MSSIPDPHLRFARPLSRAQRAGNSFTTDPSQLAPCPRLRPWNPSLVAIMRWSSFWTGKCLKPGCYWGAEAGPRPALETRSVVRSVRTRRCLSGPPIRAAGTIPRAGHGGQGGIGSAPLSSACYCHHLTTWPLMVRTCPLPTLGLGRVCVCVCCGHFWGRPGHETGRLELMTKVNSDQSLGWLTGPIVVTVRLRCGVTDARMTLWFFVLDFLHRPQLFIPLFALPLFSSPVAAVFVSFLPSCERHLQCSRLKKEKKK